MMEIQRCIEAPLELRRQVAEELNMSEGAMSCAMNFDPRRNGDKSREARAKILASGQARIMNYIPECETIHDSDGFMRQTFDSGYRLVLEKSTGRYWVYLLGEEEEGKEKLSGQVNTITEFSSIQRLIEMFGL